jgi:hypothetical protein
MARRFTLELIMDLASRIGANPAKAMSRSNISFLGKGPTKNPLFQERLAGLENATTANLGKPETLFAAIDDAVGWAKDGKLNIMQTEILGHNLLGIKNVLHPPVLPSASVTPIASGIEGLKRFPKESHKFFGRPLKGKDFSEIDRMVMEGKIPDARGRTWDLSKARNEKFLKNMGDDLQKTRLQETGPERYNRLTGLDKSKAFMGWTPKAVPKKASLVPTQESFLKQLDEKILQAEEGFLTRADLNTMSPEVLDNLRRTVDPIGMHKMFGEITKFASGGLADILQVRSGYSKGRIAKNVLSILNRNKKNADYMFKASDNVSPGYAKGDLKYNAELLADQLAEDAGVVYDDLGALERTEFYGTAYDYLAKEMMQYRQMTKMLTDVEQKMQLSDFSIKGRKPNASGGLARILEV